MIISVIFFFTIVGVVFIFLNSEKNLENIKIGVCTDLDMPRGQNVLNGAILAAEEINAAGGILGRRVEIIAEDSDVEDIPLDPTKAILALSKLITFHDVDFVIVCGGEDFVIESSAEHKTIVFGTLSPSDSLTQRIIDDYDKYKYFFRLGINQTTFNAILIDSIVSLRDITGFNQVAYIAPDLTPVRPMVENLEYYLPEVHGFNIVYGELYPPETIDFSSYFARAEAAGAEIIIPLMVTQEGLFFVKEWYDRQSPMVIWGMNTYASQDNGWNASNGKVVYTTGYASSVLQLDYLATTKTLATKNALLNRWGTMPNLQAVSTYDCIRFLLFDALIRAQTTETDSMIKALEESNIENSLEMNFRFTSSHDHFHSSASETAITMMVQWQENGTKAIVYPKKIMEEAEATFKFPPWSGPWDNIS